MIKLHDPVNARFADFDDWHYVANAINDGAVLLQNGTQLTAADCLDNHKADIKSAINSLRDTRISAGVNVGGVTFDSDTAAQGNVTGAVVMAQLSMTQGQPFSIDWITADNASVTLDTAGVIGLGVAISHHKSEQIQLARLAKDEVLSAADFAAVDAALHSYEGITP